MRLLVDYKVKMRCLLKSSALLGVIVFAIYIVCTIMESIFKSGETISGIDSMGAIFLFVIGIVYYKINLKQSFANGISRKTNFVTTLLAGLTASFILFLGFLALQAIFGLFVRTSSDFAVMYKDYGFANQFSFWINKIVYDVVTNFSSFIGGAFVGALYYRMNKGLRITVSVGVPVIFFVGMPIAAYYAQSIPAISNIVKTASLWFMGVMSVPYQTNLFDIAACLLTIVLFWLLSRKSPIKANA